MNRMRSEKRLSKIFKGWKSVYSRRYEIDWDSHNDRPIFAVHWILTDGQGGRSDWDLIEKEGAPNELEMFFRSLPTADDMDSLACERG